MSLSFRTQNRLASLIQTIAEAEKKTEVTRQVLAEQKLFEPHTAFRRLDLTRDGYVTSSELIEFLNSNNVVATTKEQLALFAGLDFNEDGLISYNDFINTILPQEDSKLKSLTTLRESYYLEAGIPLPYEVEWGLTRVFEQEIKNYRNIENQKDVLAASYDYNTLDAFNTIDEEQLGFIDYESIDKFQRNNSKILSEDEIQAFLRVAGENGRVNYTQFANAVGGTRTIQPVSSPSKLERTISPYKSRDNYYNTLQDQLNRSMERQRQLKLEQSIVESQDRLNRSIDLARSQQKVDQLERQKSIDRLNRSIQLQQSASRVERELERQRSQERLNALEKSIDLQRSIERSRIERELERQRSQDRLNALEKSIDLQKSIERQRLVEKELDRQRSKDRLQALERSIDLQKSIERQNRQLELQKSIERTNRQIELQKSIDRTNRQLELQKSQDRIDRLNRSIELQKSQDRLEKSIQLQQAQDRLNRSIERTRQLELENELAKSRRDAEQANLELELQKSLNKSRRLESELLEASYKGSNLNTPLKGNEESVLVNSLKQQINAGKYPY